MIEPRINQPRAHPLGRLAPTRDEIEEVLSVFGGPEDEGRGQEDRWFDGSFRQLRIVAVVQHQRFGMQHVVANVGLRRKRFHHGMSPYLDSERRPALALELTDHRRITLTTKIDFSRHDRKPAMVPKYFGGAG